jgi:hypothetical protein
MQIRQIVGSIFGVTSVLFMALFVGLPLFAYGGTYYVAKTGSDSYICDQARSAYTAKLTLAAGLACMAPGDTLIIKSGTYAESITYNQIVSGISDSNRTIIKANPGDTVILRPTGGNPETGDVVWIHGKSYVTFDGLTLDASNAKRMAFFANEAGSAWPSFITVQNSVLMNARSSNCVGVQPGNTFRFANNIIHDCGETSLAHGIYLRGSDHLVERNEIFNSAGYGVHLYWESASTNRNIVRYNHIHHSKGGAGIILGSGSNNVAHHNLVDHNSMGGIRVGYYGAENNQVYANTIYSNGGPCIVVLNSSKYAQVYDNICRGNEPDTVINGGRNSFVRNTK